MPNYEKEVVEKRKFPEKAIYFGSKLIAGLDDTVYIEIFYHSGNFGILLN